MTTSLCLCLFVSLSVCLSVCLRVGSLKQLCYVVSDTEVQATISYIHRDQKCAVSIGAKFNNQCSRKRVQQLKKHKGLCFLDFQKKRKKVKT